MKPMNRNKNNGQRSGAKQPIRYAFVDSQNLNLGIQRAGWKLDWKKFYAFLTKQYNVKRAYLFIGYVPEYEEMYEQLHSIGYSIVLKPTIDMLLTPEQKAERDKQSEGEEHAQTKGNIDAELVLQAMKDLSEYDEGIVVSGDGDFYCLVEYLNSVNKFGRLFAPNRNYSSFYTPFSGKIVRLDTMRRQLEYKIHGKKRPSKS